MPLLVASTDHSPITHVLPHPLHENPIVSVPVGGGDIPALHVYDGRYDFFITNHLMMSLVKQLQTQV